MGTITKLMAILGGVFIKTMFKEDNVQASFSLLLCIFDLCSIAYLHLLRIILNKYCTNFFFINTILHLEAKC